MGMGNEQISKDIGKNDNKRSDCEHEAKCTFLLLANEWTKMIMKSMVTVAVTHVQ